MPEPYPAGIYDCSLLLGNCSATILRQITYSDPNPLSHFQFVGDIKAGK
jgi:hypothetical protein